MLKDLTGNCNRDIYFETPGMYDHRSANEQSFYKYLFFINQYFYLRNGVRGRMNIKTTL